MAVTLLVPCLGQVNILTQDYDIARTGANLSETTLSPSSVSSSTFGKLFSLAVDEEVFAQPLYMSNLFINGAYDNTVFVATNGNSVYAFDADDPAQAAQPLWHVNLGPPIPSGKYLFRSASPASGSSERR
jgi:hypothetical protein